MKEYKSNTLQNSIQYVKGVGPKVSEILSKIGIRTIQDALYYFPRSYDDRRNIPKINQLVIGDKQKCLGIIKKITERKTRNRKSIIKVLIHDESGEINAVWFNQPYLKRNLKTGQKILISGKYEFNQYDNEHEIMCSEYEIIQPRTEKESLGLVVPIYSLTEGLYQWKIRTIIKEILKNYSRDILDPYPDDFLKEHGLMPLQKAVINMHYPKDSETYKKAKGRIVFDEFFFLQLALAIRRHKQIYEKKGYAFNVSNLGLLEKYLQNLPFELTNAQKSAIEDIKKDMASEHPMNRLIQGDVGSGKTEVAIAAVLIAIENGYQTAFMAPTEILAEQQYKRIINQCRELSINVLLLMGSVKGKDREYIISEIEKGKPLILVGTHALIQENIKIPNLGFAVIDEQHRFGVLQRTALKEKGYNPDLLFMTATPIPRSMLLTCYGDLDKSIIDEMPPGRIPQATFFETEDNIGKIYNFIKAKLGDDEQAFIVYPLVEESEKIDLKAAVESAEYLKKKVFNKNDVALIHGRMKNDEKEEIMNKFREGKTKVLVSTTVIEVGVDVPKANIMVVMHAERFGLSQLHQLRGRVGRSDKKSYCFLIGEPKNETAKERLMALVDYTDGFKIAEIDLKLRGPGDYYGLRQSGMPDFVIADIVKDEKILLAAKKAAFEVVEEGLNKYPDIENEIKKRREVYKIENILH